MTVVAGLVVTFFCLAPKSTVVLYFSLRARFHSVGEIIEGAKPKLPGIKVDVRLPFLHSAMPGDTLHAARAGRASLSREAVLLPGGEPQIGNAIVGLIRIYVINIHRWVFAVMQFPDEAMLSKGRAKRVDV